MFPSFPGSGAGRVGGGSLLQLLVQTPWLSYIFAVLLVYCLLSVFIEKKKIIGLLQITIAVCIPVVLYFKGTQEHGWEYLVIWIFGGLGCLSYWLDRLIIDSNSDYPDF